MPLDIPDDWTPTSAAINALPEPLRRFIRDIETRADPAGDVRDRLVARENAAALAVRVATLSRIIRRALASGQLEKLEDAKLYLSDETPDAKPDHHYIGHDGAHMIVRGGSLDDFKRACGIDPQGTPCPKHPDGVHRFGETGPDCYRTFTLCKCGASRQRQTPVSDPNEPDPSGAPQIPHDSTRKGSDYR